MIKRRAKVVNLNFKGRYIEDKWRVLVSVCVEHLRITVEGDPMMSLKQIEALQSFLIDAKQEILERKAAKLDIS